MVNELHAAMQQKRSKVAIGEILDGLAEYTVNHFAGEESAFARTGYPEDAEHRRLHKKLIDQGRGVTGAFFVAGQTVLTQDVITFLQDWLTKHIKGTDKRYGPHLKKNGVT